jgi:hypothetical protein
MKEYSDQNLMLAKQNSNSQSRNNKVNSTPMHSENLYTVRSNPNLLNPGNIRRKLNRDRINSQIFNKDDMNEKDFIVPADEESVSETDDTPDKNP